MGLLGNQSANQPISLTIAGKGFCRELVHNTTSDMPQHPTAVSLFSGLGGLDIGAHLAGAETLLCVDNDPAAAATLRKNSQYHSGTPRFGSSKFNWRVIEQDIRDLEITDIRDALTDYTEEDPQETPPVDLLIGGPPCQAFSRSNEGFREGTDSELGKLYRSYETILAALNPVGFLFENVVGVLSSNGGDDIDAIKQSLRQPTDENDGTVSKAYNLRCMKLDAANYGVPQSRERVFIFGVREDCGCPPTKSDVTEPKHLGGWKTAGEALEEFSADAGMGPYQNAIRSKYAGFLHRIPEGANYQHFSDRKYVSGEYVERSTAGLAEKEWDWRSRHWNYLLKLDPDQPAWTLQAQPGSTVGPFHWRSRPLSFVEQLRLMTIPVWYEIAGSPKAIQRQIGNAVPPYMSCAVTGALLEAIGISRSPRVLRRPEQFTVFSGSNQKNTEEIRVSASPWDQLSELITELHQRDNVGLRAERDKIPQLIDVLELFRYWVENASINQLYTEIGKRPDPNESRTYRFDTPAPSILNANVSLSDESVRHHISND